MLHHFRADQHVEREAVPEHQVPVQVALANRLVAHLGELHHHQVALVVHQHARALVGAALLDRLQQHVRLVLHAVADEQRVAGLWMTRGGSFNRAGRVIDADHVKKLHMPVLQPLAQGNAVHLVPRVEQGFEDASRTVGIDGDLGKRGEEEGTLVRLRMMMRPCWSRQGNTPWVKKITSSSERPKK